MTLHPRRDVVYVAVSTAEGGCGASHSRTVTHGVPDPDWSLTCPPCERHLINDPRWAVTKAEIPETPDEVTQREALEKRGSRDRETVITAALAKLAGIADNTQAQAVTQAVICKRGHQNLPSSRYCGECGISLTSELPPDAITKTIAHLTENRDNPTGDLSKLPVSQLRRIAESRGINPAQNKRSLVEALS